MAGIEYKVLEAKNITLESLLQAGRSSCCGLHYLGGRNAKGDGG
jgi:hypothetical protein